MKSKRNLAFYIAIIVSVLLVLAIVIIAVVGAMSVSSGVAETIAEQEFICNNDYTVAVDETGSEAEQKIKAFAEAHGLSVDEWPEELVELLEKNPETEEFVLNYPLMKDANPDIDLNQYEYTDSVPLFLQWDQRWGYYSYGNNMIANAGCGPTCLSMVCVHLLGDTSLNPKAMAEFSTEYGYCVPDNGSSWTLISEGGELLGLDIEELPLDEYTIMWNLKAGNPIICIMGPGDFTTGGHFIVMTDYIDGKIKINDPNSVIRSEKLWDYDDIKDQINNLWSCSTW